MSDRDKASQKVPGPLAPSSSPVSKWIAPSADHAGEDVAADVTLTPVEERRMQLRNVVFPILALGLAGACSPRAEPASDASDTTAVTTAAPANDPAAVRQEIEAANARFKDAMAMGDTAAMLANYADDAVIMGPGEPMARGREALAKAFQGMLSQFTIKDATVNTEDVMVGGDLAVETGTFQWTVVPKTGQGNEVVTKGKYLTAWKQQADGSWKIVRDINNTDEPPK
jgi:uncharacterized protein (TIGR02246 family)